MHAYPRDAIRAGSKVTRTAEYWARGTGIRPAIEIDRHIERYQCAVVLGAESIPHERGMSFRMSEKRFGAAIGRLDRSAQCKGSDGEMCLQRDVFSSAERTANPGVDEVHLLGG